MKTTAYNPSPLEVEFANILEGLKDKIGDNLDGHKIIGFEKRADIDNPILKVTLQDQDGDRHVVIIQIIQKPDPMI